MASPSSLPINRIILSGEVVDEPLIHYLAPGYPEVRLRLLTREELPIFGGKETQERQLWHALVARGAVGVQIEQAVHTGTHLSVVGRIDYHRETDRHGQTKLTTEILVEQIQLHQPAPAHASPPPSAPAPRSDAPRFDAGRYASTETEDPLA